MNSTVTSPDGDVYSVFGSFSGTNNSDGSGFSANHPFEVAYEGNAMGGPSAADTITVEAFDAYQATVGGSTFSRSVTGAFGPTIAAASSASSCVNGTLGCVGPVTPPGSFDPTTTFPVSSSGGVFTYDPASPITLALVRALAPILFGGKLRPYRRPCQSLLVLHSPRWFWAESSPHVFVTLAEHDPKALSGSAWRRRCKTSAPRSSLREEPVRISEIRGVEHRQA